MTRTLATLYHLTLIAGFFAAGLCIEWRFW
jgi:hypothetical protein